MALTNPELRKLITTAKRKFCLPTRDMTRDELLKYAIKLGVDPKKLYHIGVITKEEKEAYLKAVPSAKDKDTFQFIPAAKGKELEKMKAYDAKYKAKLKKLADKYGYGTAKYQIKADKVRKKAEEHYRKRGLLGFKYKAKEIEELKEGLKEKKKEVTKIRQAERKAEEKEKKAKRRAKKVREEIALLIPGEIEDMLSDEKQKSDLYQTKLKQLKQVNRALRTAIEVEEEPVAKLAIKKVIQDNEKRWKDWHYKNVSDLGFPKHTRFPEIRLEPNDKEIAQAEKEVLKPKAPYQRIKIDEEEEEDMPEEIKRLRRRKREEKAKEIEKQREEKRQLEAEKARVMEGQEEFEQEAKQFLINMYKQQGLTDAQIEKKLKEEIGFD